MKHCRPQEDDEKEEEEEECEEKTKKEAKEDWCMREIFVEPVEWMRASILGKLDGKVSPNC